MKKFFLLLAIAGTLVACADKSKEEKAAAEATKNAAEFAGKAADGNVSTEDAVDYSKKQMDVASDLYE